MATSVAEKVLVITGTSTGRRPSRTLGHEAGQGGAAHVDDAGHRHPSAQGLGDRDDVLELARRRDPDDRVARAERGLVGPELGGRHRDDHGSSALARRRYSVAAARLEW